MRTKSTFVAGMVLLLATVPVWAHHSLAAKYNTRQSIMLKGTVIKIDWANPHVHLYLQAADSEGSVASWDFEMGSPNLLFLNGWNISTFRRGDQVMVTAYPALDGSKLGYASKVALSAQ